MINTFCFFINGFLTAKMHKTRQKKAKQIHSRVSSWEWAKIKIANQFCFSSLILELKISSVFRFCIQKKKNCIYLMLNVSLDIWCLMAEFGTRSLLYNCKWCLRFEDKFQKHWHFKFAIFQSIFVLSRYDLSRNKHKAKRVINSSAQLIWVETFF